MIKCCKHQYYQYNRKIPVNCIYAVITHILQLAWTKEHVLQKYAWAGKIFRVCACHKWWLSCGFAVDPSAQPRGMIQQSKQTLQCLKSLTKQIWVSIYTELKGPKRHSAVNATKPEATPWSAACRPLPSCSLLVSAGSPQSQSATEHGKKVARTQPRGHSWK